MSKIILDLCGGTGSWSRFYKELGYDVRVITLPDYDVRTYQPPRGVYGILAAPPCTEFSVLNCKAEQRIRDFGAGMEIVNACLRIIGQCNPTFWAMENPRGISAQVYRDAKNDFPALAIRRSLDKVHRYLGKFSDSPRFVL